MNPPPPRRVLIVDDERTIANTLAAIFTRAGYESSAVYSAEQALKLLDGDLEWRPDFAILDVCLPGMHGIDLAILLQVRYPDCSIALFSGQPATEDLLDGARKNGHSFEILAKPIHPEELLARAALRPPAG